jgi:transposase-like protein
MVMKKETNNICDKCGSSHTVRHGTNTTISKGKRHRRKCQDCGHTFYEE